MRLKKSFNLHAYDVDIVPTLHGFIDKIIEEPKYYDLVIIDLDGRKKLTDIVDFCKSLREHNINTPVLVVNDEGGIVERMEMLESGASDYIIKPFSIAELMYKVGFILGGNSDVKISNEKIKIDLTNQHLYINGKGIALTIKEFGILQYLANNLNKVVTREMIFENVWQFDSRSSSNVIDVHIKNIRKKVKAFMERGLIETEWGGGYRFAS